MANVNSRAAIERMEAWEKINTFSQCRGFGHQWVRRPKSEYIRKSETVVGVPSLCSNCSMRRVQWANAKGESLGLEYDRPSDYLQKQQKVDGVKIPSKRTIDWREMFVTSIIDSTHLSQ